ncbi:MAG TPA: protein phosphatase 2C domain-containing protein [Oligoflexia bacterium]|nr:protein phosphatase 2C domain-containing protein [Oligoflexia bacterium]HMP47160.1 protein phosphatase 2C domain-containing protein [Oligoflexia bacterium]
MGKSSQKVLLEYWGRSDIGKVRKENQDAYGFIARKDWCLMVVCDGMGGTRGGGIASALAIETVTRILEELSSSSLEDFVPAREQIISAINRANSLIYSYGRKVPGLEEMGTTLVALFVGPDGAISFHVGDSRLYRVNKSGIQQITKDHTWVQELVDSGALNQTQAERSPVSHLLTRSLGTQVSIKVDVMDLEALKEGEIYLLCTDGLYNLVSESRIYEETGKITGNRLPKLVDSLVELSLRAGGKDNITVFAVLVNFIKNASENESSLLKGFDSGTQLSTRSGLDIPSLLGEIPDNKDLIEHDNSNSEDGDSDDNFSKVIETLSDNEDFKAVSKHKSVSGLYGSQVKVAPYFIFGVFSSLVILLFIAVRGGDNSLTTKMNTLTEGFQASSGEYVQSDKYLKAFLPLSPSPLSDLSYVRRYAEEKTGGLFLFPDTPPQVRRFSRRPPVQRVGSLSIDRPIRPIIWENELPKIHRIRAGKDFAGGQIRKDKVSYEEKKPADDELLPSSLNDVSLNGDKSYRAPKLVLTDDEIADIVMEKDIVRLRLADLDEKIIQLALTNLSEVENHRTALNLRLNLLDDDLLEVEREFDVIKNKFDALNLAIHDYKKGKGELIARNIVKVRPELRKPLESIDQERKLLVQYKNKLADNQDIEDQIEMANRLASLNRSLDKQLIEINAVVDSLLREYQSVLRNQMILLRWLSLMISDERVRVARGLGFLDIGGILTAQRSADLYRHLVEKRIATSRELENLRLKVSDEDEFAKGLSEIERNLFSR